MSYPNNKDRVLPQVLLLCLMLTLPSSITVEASVEQGDIQYILDVGVEPDESSFPPDEEPFNVDIQFDASCFGRYEDGSKVMFPGDVNVTYQIYTGNGTIELSSLYEIDDPEQGIYMTVPTEYVTMSDELWTVRLLIESDPSMDITFNDIYVMRRGSLIMVVHDDYYESFIEDMPDLLDLFHDAYRELIDIGGLGAPLTLTLQTLCEVCMVAWSGYAVCPLSYGRESQSLYSDFMKDDGFILGIFHEMTHALLNVNYDVFFFHGSATPAYQGEWFIEGEANYIGCYLLPKLLGDRVFDFVSQASLERFSIMGEESLKLMLENNGKIMNTDYRTSPEAGTPLQLGSHPEVEGHGLLQHIEENYRPDYIRFLYGYLRQFFDILPAEYSDWSDVWEGVDMYAMDTILIGLMGKAACSDLTPLFEELSFQIYSQEELEPLIDPSIYEAYTSIVGDSAIARTSLEVEFESPQGGATEGGLIRATLMDGGGSPIDGERIDFYVGGSFCGFDLTDDTGIAEIRMEPYEGEQGNIIACYAGSHTCLQSLGRADSSSGEGAGIPRIPEIPGFPMLSILIGFLAGIFVTSRIPRMKEMGAVSHSVPSSW